MEKGAKNTDVFWGDCLRKMEGSETLPYEKKILKGPLVTHTLTYEPTIPHRIPQSVYYTHIAVNQGGDFLFEARRHLSEPRP